MKNRFEIRGEVTAVFLRQTHGPDVETVIDTADLELVANIPGSWTIARKKRLDNRYVKTNLRRVNGVRGEIKLHRLILGLAGSELTGDHIDFNGLNNRRSNLQPLPGPDNSGKHPPGRRCGGAKNNSHLRGDGAHWRPDRNKWVARMMVNGKRKYLGVYSTRQEAQARAAKYVETGV